MNWVYSAIEDVVISSLENGPWLPKKFELTIEDAAFQQLLKSLKMVGTNKPVPLTVKRVTLQIQDRIITVRSDNDPEPWLPIAREETLN